MTNAQTPHNSHGYNGSTPTQTAGRPARSGYLTRRSDEACWYVTVRTASAFGRVSTGTTDEGQARAFAATLQADADAGRFALDTTPTDERTRTLLEGIERFAARRRRRGSCSATKAGDGQSEIRKQGS